jgi:hypothetical protein
MNKNSLSEYETVKQRKKRLRNDFKNSVIFPLPLSDINQSYNYILMGALIWKDKKVFEQMTPETLQTIQQLTENVSSKNIGVTMASIGVLTKADGIGYSLSIAGGTGADRSAWVENAEESAVGRALDNMGYNSGSCSKEEIDKVPYIEQARADRQQLISQINQLFIRANQAGINSKYLQQICYQAIHPFNQLNELSPQELRSIVDLLNQQLNGYKNQQLAP